MGGPCARTAYRNFPSCHMPTLQPTKILVSDLGGERPVAKLAVRAGRGGEGVEGCSGRSQDGGAGGSCRENKDSAHVQGCGKGQTIIEAVCHFHSCSFHMRSTAWPSRRPHF